MDPVLAPYYARARDHLTEEEFAARLARERETFGGLLDDETLALLVLDELGLNEGAYVTLGELKGRSEATVRVTLESVEPPRVFTRGNGSEGRVANCLVSDATGTARMVLWDRDVEKIEDGSLWRQCRLTLVNARVKEGTYGVELHVGPWTVLEVEGALDPARRKLLQDVAAEPEPKGSVQTTLPREEATLLAGTLTEIHPTRPYRRTDGTTGFVCDADVQTEDGLARLVAWDEQVRALRSIPVGTPLVAEGLAQKVRGMATEWHTVRGSVLRRG